jgi:hypothetical protein
MYNKAIIIISSFLNHHIILCIYFGDKPIKFSLTGERRRLESNYNSAEGVFLTLTLTYFAKVAVDHLWYNLGTNFADSVSAIRSVPALLGITLLPGRSGLLNHLPLSSRLRLPSEAYFILTDSRPELSYSDSWSSTRARLAKREACVQHDKERLQDSVLNRHRRSHYKPASLHPVFISN